MDRCQKKTLLQRTCLSTAKISSGNGFNIVKISKKEPRRVTLSRTHPTLRCTFVSEIHCFYFSKWSLQICHFNINIHVHIWNLILTKACICHVSGSEPAVGLCLFSQFIITDLYTSFYSCTLAQRCLLFPRDSSQHIPHSLSVRLYHALFAFPVVFFLLQSLPLRTDYSYCLFITLQWFHFFFFEYRDNDVFQLLERGIYSSVHDYTLHLADIRTVDSHTVNNNKLFMPTTVAQGV